MNYYVQLLKVIKFIMDTKASTENGQNEMPSTSSAMAKTTTISTIAVQSGKTRIVIALLHVGFLISLKMILTLYRLFILKGLRLLSYHLTLLKQ